MEAMCHIDMDCCENIYIQHIPALQIITLSTEAVFALPPHNESRY